MSRQEWIDGLEEMNEYQPNQDEIDRKNAEKLSANPYFFQNTLLPDFLGYGKTGLSFFGILCAIINYFPTTFPAIIKYWKANDELLTFFGHTLHHDVAECFSDGFWGFGTTNGIACKKSFKIAFHWNPLGHYGLYIAVPPRHTLFGKSYESVPNATFSGFLEQIPGNWWAFGIDFGKRYDMTVPNIINRHLPPMVETPNIDDLDILTVSKLNDITESIVFYLREIHKKNTGFEYSSWNHGNKRQRQRWARRAEQVRNNK